MKKLPLLVAAGLVATASAASARDYIEIVGSSTVYPFTTVVAETFGNKTKFKTPKIESTGTGGGMKLFCSGTGIDTPDITNASRRMKSSEFEDCQKNGVKDIVEIQVGFDGIAIANSKEADQMELTRKDLFLALAKSVPGKTPGELIPNPYQTWQDVNPALPATKIEVLGPPPTSGTRDAFAELAMEGGCKAIPEIAALKKTNGSLYKEVCHSVREDGAYIEAGENDNLIVQKLEKNPKALGVFGFSFLDQNADKVQGSKIDGVELSFDSIADGNYPVSRPLYFYVKSSHVGKIPGIKEFLAEFVTEDAFGEEGYLTEKGLIPMPEENRESFRQAATELKSLSL
jgi:phosphate transport system substrate-binding protein